MSGAAEDVKASKALKAALTLTRLHLDFSGAAT